MLRSYLIILFRNLRRRKVFPIVNVSGLAVGIASCLLILLYVQDELSYDRFLNHTDRLYRVTTHFSADGKESGYATSPPPLAAVMQQKLPDVQATTRVCAGMILLCVPQQVSIARNHSASSGYIMPSVTFLT